MVLDAGAAHGFMLYRVFGSFSGTAPGLLFGDIFLPLNFDGYFEVTLFQPKIPSFGGFKFSLDANGQSTASLTVFPGLDPTLAGITLHHAFIATEIFGLVHFASNAIPVILVP